MRGKTKWKKFYIGLFQYLKKLIPMKYIRISWDMTCLKILLGEIRKFKKYILATEKVWIITFCENATFQNVGSPNFSLCEEKTKNKKDE